MTTQKNAVDGDDRRTCAVCKQNKRLSEFGKRNGRPRRECWTCRAVRKIRKAEEERQAAVLAGIKKVIAALNSDRVSEAKINELIAEAAEPAGGLRAFAETWYSELRFQEWKRPGCPFVLASYAAIARIATLVNQAATTAPADR